MSTKSNILFLSLLVVALFTFASCWDDDDYSLGKFWINRATVVTSGGSDAYSFILDDGTTLWVAANNTYYRNPANGQRVFINYTVLTNEQNGYDHYIRLNDVSEILTKDIIDLTEVNADSVGDDPVKLWKLTTNGGYLNVDFGFNYGGERQHLINLVRNTTVQHPDNDTVYLEFRHNAYNDAAVVGTEAYAAFNLNRFMRPDTDSVNVVVRVNEFEGVKNYDLVYRYKSNVPVGNEATMPSAVKSDGYH